MSAADPTLTACTDATAAAADPALLVLVSAPPDVAESLATALVERQLAACVSLLPGLQSIYRWQGVVEHSGETQLLIKTRNACLEPLRAAVLALHPYELPEILAVRIDDGLPSYLQWLYDSTATPI